MATFVDAISSDNITMDGCVAPFTEQLLSRSTWSHTWSQICFYIHRGLDDLFILIIKDFKNRWKDWVMLINNKVGSRTISPEENCPQTLKLILTQTQTMTLTGGQFFSGSIVLIPIKGSNKGSRKSKTNKYS